MDMKKTILKLLFFLICFCCGGYLLHEKDNRNELTDIAFNNIEALANNEGSDRFFCYEIGSLDCNGQKVKYRINTLSFGID